MRVRALNPEVRVEAHALRLDAHNAERLCAGHDLILDCSDNFTTKFLLNDLALRTGKPVMFASVYQYEGQLQLVRGDNASACLRCVWPEARDGLVGNCAEAGVLGPVPGVFGSLQALEALKLLLGLPGLKPDEMLIFDLITLSTQRLRARRQPECEGASACRQLRPVAWHPRNSKCSSARLPTQRAPALFSWTCAIRASARPNRCRPARCTCPCPNY
jgi:adenylyltransferase/sulfurtransferase